MRKQRPTSTCQSNRTNHRQLRTKRPNRLLLLALVLTTASTTLFIYGQDLLRSGSKQALPTATVSPEILQKYDLNRNGKLDPDEREALRKDVIARLNALRAKSRQSRGLSPDGSQGPQDKAAREARLAQLRSLHAKALEKYDLNHNGVLDPEEKAMMKRDREVFLKKIQVKLLEKYDVNRNGVLDPEEREAIRAAAAAKRQETLAKYDKNHDGRLDDAERAAAIAELRATKDLKK